MLGKIEGGRRGPQRMRCLDGSTDSMHMSVSKLWEAVTDREAWETVTDREAWEAVTDREAWEAVTDREAWHAAVCGVAKSQTRLSD